MSTRGLIFLLGLFAICQAELEFTCTFPKERPDVCEISNQNIAQQENVTFTNANEEIKELRFVNSNASHVPLGIFKSLPNLEILRLDNLTMQTVDDKAFVDAKSLVELQATNNTIEILTEKTFSEATSLKVLNLSINKIWKLNSLPFAKLTELTELYLDENKIEEFTKDYIKENKKLEKISLANNKYIKIANGTFNDFKELKEIDLHGNLCGFQKFTITDSNFDEINSKLSDETCSSAIKISATMLSLMISLFLSFILFK